MSNKYLLAGSIYMMCSRVELQRLGAWLWKIILEIQNNQSATPSENKCTIQIVKNEDISRSTVRCWKGEILLKTTVHLTQRLIQM